MSDPNPLSHLGKPSQIPDAPDASTLTVLA